MALNFLNDGYFAGKVGIVTTSPSAELDVDGVIRSRGGTYAADIDTKTDVGLIIPENYFIYTADGSSYLRKLIGKTSDIITIGEAGTSLIDGINLVPGTSGGYVQIFNNSSIAAKFVDGKLGIGTTIPGYKLDVRADNGDVGQVFIKGGNSTVTAVGEINSELLFGSNDTSVGQGNIGGKISSVTETTNGAYTGMAFYTYRQTSPLLTEKMRITNDGNVGIGTTSPNHKLDIYSNENVPLRIHRPNNANLDSDGAWGIGFYTRGDAVTSTTDTRSGIFSYYNGNLFLATNNTRIDQDPFDYARLTILNGGNVGIGTTSPVRELEVQGAGNVYIRVTAPTDNDSSALELKNTQEMWTIRNEDTNADALHFNSDGGTKMVIETGGNVGIGTTSPSANLYVSGSNADATDKPTMISESVFTVKPVALNSGNLNFAQVDSGNSIGMQYTNGAGTANWDISMQPFGGNVGIGTTSPKQKLHVSGGTTAGDVTKMVIGATGGNAESYLYLAELFSGDNVNYGFSFVADGNSSNNLLFKRHSNSTSGTTVMEIRRDSDQIRFNGYSGTNQTGTPTYILGTTSGGDIVKVLGGDIPIAAPAAPSTVTSTIVGETIEIEFNQSSTSNIDYYQVWSSDDGGDYGIIGQIAPVDFSSTMTVVDTTFVTGGTMSYRVYAVKTGIYSSAATTSKSYTVSALSVTAMTVVNLNTAYYIQYEKPVSRFIDHIEIYMDSQTTLAALNRNNASIVYSGQNASYMRNVNTSNNFHQFWVEVVTT